MVVHSSYFGGMCKALRLGFNLSVSFVCLRKKMKFGDMCTHISRNIVQKLTTKQNFMLPNEIKVGHLFI